MEDVWGGNTDTRSAGCAAYMAVSRGWVRTEGWRASEGATLTRAVRGVRCTWL